MSVRLDGMDRLARDPVLLTRSVKVARTFALARMTLIAILSMAPVSAFLVISI